MEQYKQSPTSRFSDRVDTYVKFRPGYPFELLSFLQNDLSLKPSATAIDVGSGTGIFSEFLLKGGYQVIGVEPNSEMRSAAESSLKSYLQFSSKSGSSEATGLPSGVGDFITAAQAFHWFEPQKTREEFKRILKPQAPVLLIWNERRTTTSPFAKEHEDLIEHYSIDYRIVTHKNIHEEEIKRFLGEHGFGSKTFYNFQDLNFEGLLGRLISSSYAPNKDNPNYPAMAEALKKLFDRYQESGKVRIEYDTKVFYGRLS